MAAYPQRDGHFAHKAIRLMIRTCAAQDIGSDACLLVTFIAHTEDAKRYTAPVTFWNDQLQSILGFTWGKLDRARKRAMAAGWLHYEAGGKAKVGRYWVTVPPQFEGVADVAVDEDHPVILSTGGGTSGEESGLSSPPVEGHPGDIRGTTGGQPGDKCGSFFPKPKPKPKKRRAANAAAVLFDPLKVDLPEGLDTPQFRQAWSDWCQHRREIQKKLTPTSVTRQLAALNAMGANRAVAAIEHTIEKGWTGIREPDSHSDRPASAFHETDLDFDPNESQDL